MSAKLNPTLWLTVLLLTAGGCKSPLPDLSAKLPWVGDDKVKETPYQQPVKMTVIWSPAMYSQPGQVPTRGFGGRFYFYNAKDEAIAVDGGLMVYAFDDTAKQNASQVPNRRFAFTAEQLKKHFSPTQLGASYSIWVPWDPVGGPQADISLLPIFSGTSGGVLTGQQSRNLLPGPETPKSETQFQQRIDTPVAASSNAAGTSVITTTIGLPQATADRLARQPIISAGSVNAAQPAVVAQAPTVLPQRSQATAGYSAPTKESRSWGPLIPRRPIRPVSGPLVRSGPGTPPAPAWRDLPPTAGLPPTPPLLGEPPSHHPAGRQSDPPSSGQVVYRDVSEIAP
jgi:hypothetical protein